MAETLEVLLLLGPGWMPQHTLVLLEGRGLELQSSWGEQQKARRRRGSNTAGAGRSQGPAKAPGQNEHPEKGDWEL